MFTFLILGSKALFVIPFIAIDYLLITGTIDLIKKLVKKNKKSLPE